MRGTRAWPLAVVGALVGLLSSCGGPTGPSAPSTASTLPSASATPSSGAPTAQSPTGSASPSASTALRVPVYWVSPTPRGPRLFREFASVPSQNGPSDAATAALAVMLNGSAADPAYRSGWPSTTSLRSVSERGAVVQVTLDLPTDSTPARDSLPVQQLVYTVTAAQPGTNEVTLRLHRPSGASTLRRLVRAPADEVIAPIWIIDPQWGAHVPGSAITVTGSASVFEAQFAWQVRHAGAVVASGTATASIGMPQRGTFSFTTPRLPAGTYVVIAFDRSMADGSVSAFDRAQVTLG